jgi:hypothetical protein
LNGNSELATQDCGRHATQEETTLVDPIKLKKSERQKQRRKRMLNLDCI